MLRIITWNIAALPKLINPYSNPFRRLEEILNKLLSTNADVICLQEVFCYKVRFQIEKCMKQKDLFVHYSNEANKFIPKNGLMIISKYPILETREMNYNKSLGMEKWVNKGVISVKLRSPDFTDIWVHNTHTQSDTKFWITSYSEYIRNIQFSLLKDYLFSFEESLDLQFLIGDLNDEYNIIKQMFSYYHMNQKSIHTFPKKKKQLDYILVNNKELDTTYYQIDCTEDKTSDHNILVCDIKTKK